MSEFKYEKCPRCGKYGWVGTHTCPPAYGVRLEGWDKEEEVEVLAYSPEEAAKKFIEDRFADFEYPQNSTVIVNDWQADHWAGRLYKYEITVEAQPVFYAELLEEKPATESEEVKDDPPVGDA